MKRLEMKNLKNLLGRLGVMTLLIFIACMSSPRSALAEDTARPSLAWAVLIAIQQYDHPKISKLQVPRDDVRALTTTLKKYGGLDSDHILTMIDDPEADEEFSPTRDNLEIKLKEFLRKPGPNDSVFFFYSGHGVVLDGKPCLVPKDADPSKKESFFESSTVGAMLSRCTARTKFLVLDCCHASDNAEAASSGRVGSAKSTTLFPSSINGTKDAIDGARKGETGTAKNVVVLASCQEKEFSWEWREKKRSVFTYWLCRALEGAADANGDGALTTDEVSDYAYSRVLLTINSLGLPKQNPARALDTSVTGNPPLLTLVPEDPKSLCDRLAGLLDEEIRLRKLKRVKVAREFRIKAVNDEKSPQGAPLGAQNGEPTLGRVPYPRDLAAAVLGALEARAKAAEPHYEISLSENVDPPRKKKSAASKSVDLTADATIFGDMSIIKQRLGLQCDLFTSEGVVARPSGFVLLTESILPDLGLSFDVSREPAPVTEAPRDPGVALEKSMRINPVLDDTSPFKIAIVAVNDPSGATRPGEDKTWKIGSHVVSNAPLQPDPRAVLFGASQGETFKIRVENRSPKRVGVVLQIDGLNVIGKVRESAEAASVIVIDPGKTAEVRGWERLSEPGLKKPGEVAAEVSQFVFESVPPELTGRATSEENIGLISAIFYEEAPAKKGNLRSLRVGEGERERHTLRAVPFNGKGRLLASLQVGYVDAGFLK